MVLGVVAGLKNGEFMMAGVVGGDCPFILHIYRLDRPIFRYSKVPPVCVTA